MTLSLDYLNPKEVSACHFWLHASCVVVSCSRGRSQSSYRSGPRAREIVGFAGFGPIF